MEKIITLEYAAGLLVKADTLLDDLDSDEGDKVDHARSLISVACNIINDTITCRPALPAHELLSRPHD